MFPWDGKRSQKEKPALLAEVCSWGGRGSNCKVDKKRGCPFFRIPVFPLLSAGGGLPLLAVHHIRGRILFSCSIQLSMLRLRHATLSQFEG